MCILLYVKLIWCSGFPNIYAWLEEGVGSVCHGYMCILLYMKLIWCSGFAEIYGQLEGGTLALSIYAFCYMWNLFGVVVFQRSMVSWRGYIGLKYICILLYVKLFWCSYFPEIYSQLGGTSAFGICVFFFMWNLFGVVVFQRSMLDWRGVRVCLPLVYVHSSICGTYLA